MPSKSTAFPFPIKGLTRNQAYQEGDEQTTRDALNVVPPDYSESRIRGGSRPGLTKRYLDGTDTIPLYIIRVSGGDESEVYEFLIVGTSANVYKGASVASGSIPPITYSEGLTALSGDLATEGDDMLITEDPDNFQLIIDAFNVSGIDPDIVIQYGDSVILGSDGVTLLDITDGLVDSSGRLDDGLNKDWVAEGVDAEQHYAEIILDDATPDELILATFAIGSVSTTTITLTADPRIDASATPTGTAVRFKIRNAVRDLNPNTPSISTLSPVSTGGFIPLGTDAVVSYRDRLVFATNRTWFMSRQGDPGDFDYAATLTDPTRAVAGTTGGPGEPADPIVAMATAGYDHLVLFSDASTNVMRGDPNYGGQLYNKSETVGCVGLHAWCHDDGTSIYFLAKDGFYLMGPNAGNITPVSPDKLPRELRGLDRDNFYVTLVYDPEDDSILIFKYPKQLTEGEHFIYHIPTDSFWPMTLMNNAYQPINAVTFGGSPARPRRAVLASSDGFIREWAGNDDDGTAITSYVVMGPYIASKGSNLDAKLAELIPTIDEDGASVTMEVYAGSSGESATKAAQAATSPNFTVTVTPGRSYTKRPRVRGNAFCIRFAATSAWAFESLIATISTGGKTRRI